MKKNAQFFTKVPSITNPVELKLVEDQEGNVTLYADMRVKPAPHETYATEGFAICDFKDGALILREFSHGLAKKMGIQRTIHGNILVK